jgi:hypothetical protein
MKGREDQGALDTQATQTPWQEIDCGMHCKGSSLVLNMDHLGLLALDKV